MSAFAKTPKLRFPEFSGKWEENKFGDLCEVIDGDRGVNYPKSNDFFAEEYCLFLNAKNVTKSGFSFNENQFITKTKDEKLSKGKLNRNDIVLTTRGTVGNFAYFSNDIEFENIRINSGMVILRPRKKVDSNFLFKISSSPMLTKQIKVIAFGSAQPQLTVKEIKKFKLYIPTKPEQQKIASFLTAVDTKIEQLTKKQELLEQYKKGVMQKIFSQEIRFRADDGSDFPEWEEKKLGECGKYSAGGDLAKLDYAKEKNGKYIYPIYANGTGEGLYGYATTFQNNAGCVTVSGRGNLGYAKARKENFNAIVRLIVIKPKANVQSKFLEEIINDIDFAIESTGVPQLTVPQISSYKIHLPCLEEQTKIADFLSSIDDKIDLVAKELENAKQFKKGLLQQMFV